jgi:hypothetical protein
MGGRVSPRASTQLRWQMQAYARQAKDTVLIKHATDIRVWVEQQAGELLREMEKNKGAVRGKTGRRS